MYRWIASILLMGSACPVFAQDKPKVILTNSDVITMLDAKVADDAIVKVIQTSPTNFDISGDKGMNLLQHKISRAVLNAMTDSTIANIKAGKGSYLKPAEPSSESSHGWVRMQEHDDLHNEDGVRFSLMDKENDAVIRVICSKGKLKTTWLHIDNVIDAEASSLYGSSVQIEWRRDDEPKAHKLSPMPVSTDFHGIQLGFLGLVYGGKEFKQNKKTNNWAKKLVIGVPIYLGSDAVLTFDVPDPSQVNAECAIK